MQRLIAESTFSAILRPSAAKDLYKSVMQRFEIAHGLLFNKNVSLNRLVSRERFAEIARKALASGQIGKRPTNLRPDLKITKEQAEELRRDGKTVEEWFIRTPEEEIIVAKMRADWEAEHGPIKDALNNEFKNGRK